MYEVITVGSGTVDVFVDTAQKELRHHKDHDDVCYSVGGKQLIKHLVLSTGGGGTNAAVAFSRLGLHTAWVGAVGSDAHGDMILDMLDDEKVAFMGKRISGQSGYSVVLVGLHKDRTILAYKGVNNFLEKINLKSLKPIKFYFSAMMGKSFQTAKKIVLRAKKEGNVPWAFNPSSYLAKKGMSYLKPFINNCSLLVCNVEEANMLCGTKGKKSEQLLPKLISAGAFHVIITDGPRGATGSNGSYHYVLKATKERVVDTTGAGDAFAAGAFHYLIKKNSLEEAMKYGYALSTSVIGYIGAKKGLLSSKALEARVKKQRVKVVKKKL